MTDTETPDGHTTDSLITRGRAGHHESAGGEGAGPLGGTVLLERGEIFSMIFTVSLGPPQTEGAPQPRAAVT